MGWDRIARGVWVGQPYLDREKSPYRDEWYVIVKHPRYRGGRQRKIRVGEEKGRAIALARQMADELDAGPSVTPTVDQLLVAWWAEYRRTFKPSTRQNHEINVHRHLLPGFAGVRVTEIFSNRLYAYAETVVAQGKGPWTVKNTLSTLRRAVNLLWRGEIEASRHWDPPPGREGANPSWRISEVISRTFDTHADQVKERVPFRHEEIRTVLAIARARFPRFYPMLLLAFATGMRQGEIRALHWDDVDLEERMIVVRRGMSLEEPAVGDGWVGCWRGTRMCPFPAPARRTVRAVLPHTAHPR